MPAITLGLAEVDERLLTLRRRLNTFTVLQAVCVALSTVVLVAAALIVLGLSASASTFRFATWFGAVISVGTLAAAVVFVRRRWLDVTATAYLADQRGQLTDRLATLVDVRLRSRPSRLAPLLVAQVLALGSKWQPQRIVPRRVPRSGFALVAALIALAASPILPPQPRPQAAPSAGSKAGTIPEAPLNSPRGGVGNSKTADGQRTDAPLSVNSLGGDQTEPSDASATAEGLQPDRLVAQFPDQIRNAILSTFHRQADDASEHGSARSTARSGERQRHGRGSGDQGESKGDGTNGPDKQSHENGDSGPKKPGGEGATGQQLAQQGPAGADPNRSGSAPAAGDGTSPGGLLGTKGTNTTTDPNAPKSFKLTITSFLHGAQQKGTVQRNPAALSGAAAGSGETGTGQLALSERQRSDDALRKAAIPAEYEDLVRRVYSARGEP